MFYRKMRLNEICQLAHSFRYAGAGIWHCICTQRNFRIHIVAACFACALAYAMPLNRSEWILLILTIAFVLARELINTSIEAVVDLVSPERCELARIAKDAAAGGVLVSAIASVAVGAVLFYRPLRLEEILALILKTEWAFPIVIASVVLSLIFIFGMKEKT